MPRLSRRTWAGVLAFVLLVGFLVLAMRAPVPYVTFAPGPTLNVLGKTDGGSGKEIVQVSGHPAYDDRGALRLVTVIPSQPRQKVALPTLIRAWLDPEVAVYPYDAIYPPQATQQTEREQSSELMTSSQDTAVAAALHALGVHFQQAVRIVGVQKDGPSHGVLESGDLFVSIAGRPVHTLDRLTSVVQRQPVGTRLTLRVQRRGKVLTRHVTTTKSPVNPAKSALRVTISPSFRFPFDVHLNIGENIGGPSGGLVFAMAVYDKLTPGSLTGGRSIAGTGEIDAKGHVAPIGGVQQKIVGAEHDDARLFLVPAANCAEAAGAHYDPDRIRLVKVTTLTGALHDVRAWVRDPKAHLPRCTR